MSKIFRESISLIADLLSRTFTNDAVKNKPFFTEIVHSIERNISIKSKSKGQFKKEIKKDDV